MTLQASQLVVLLTKPDATGGYNAAQTNPQASLGKYASTTQVATATSNNLFGPVSTAGVTAGQTDYACVAIANVSAVDTAQSATVALTDYAGGGSYAIGLDPVGVVPLTGAAAQGTSIATPTTAPTGVVFSAGPLSIGNIPPNYCILVWVQCVVPAGTPGTSADQADIIAQCVTA